MTTIVTRMQEITISICEKLDSIQTESLQVGALLIEANEILQEEGKKQPEFLAYCKENFSIGKSQAYKLMKVSKFFAEDTRFKGVAMRVLYVLATEANEEELEKAAELAANDSLNTGTLNAILHPEPVKPVEPVAPKQSPEEVKESEEETNNSLDSVPFDVDEQIARNDAIQEGAPRTTQEILESADDETKAVLDDKDRQIATLESMLKKLQETVASFEKKAAIKPAAPLLPQFKSKNPCVVLGIAESDAGKITVVRKAFREIIACGYGEGHEAFEQLTKAKDSLLADIEAAKQAA